MSRTPRNYMCDVTIIQNMVKLFLVHSLSFIDMNTYIYVRTCKFLFAAFYDRVAQFANAFSDIRNPRSQHICRAADDFVLFVDDAILHWAVDMLGAERFDFRRRRLVIPHREFDAFIAERHCAHQRRNADEPYGLSGGMERADFLFQQRQQLSPASAEIR